MKSRQNQKGQVVVEYVMLLVIAVTIAALVVRQLGSRDPEDTGLLVVAWQKVLTSLSKDLPDQCQGSGCN